MARHTDQHVRLFATVAEQRLEDATWLFQSGRYNACVYLAGYAVECYLKALLLSSMPAAQRTNTVRSFRGVRAHDFEMLRRHYLRAGGAGLPREVVHAFDEVNDWAVNLRYNPRQMPAKDARNFMHATRVITAWAKGRL